MKKINFTCADYRKEMMLVQLRQRLRDENLEPEKKQALARDIENLEIELGIH
jgi:hypothetical protein